MSLFFFIFVSIAVVIGALMWLEDQAETHQNVTHWSADDESQS